MNVTNDSELCSIVSKERDDFIRSNVKLSPLPGSEYKEGANLNFYCTGVNFMFLNGVIEKREGYLPSQNELESALQFFKDRNLPFIWWSSNENIKTLGFQKVGVSTGIILDLSEKKFDVCHPIKNLMIRNISAEDEIRVFAETLVESYGLPPEITDQFSKVNSGVLQGGKRMHLAVFSGDTIIGAITISFNQFSAGLWNLCVLPKYRSKGIGRFLLKAAILEVKKHNIEKVVAVLDAEKMAKQLCSKLGFYEVMQFPSYSFTPDQRF